MSLDSLSVNNQMFMSPIDYTLATGQVYNPTNAPLFGNSGANNKSYQDIQREEWEAKLAGSNTQTESQTEEPKKKKGFKAWWNRVTGGTDITMEEYEALPGWKKAIRQAGNALTGVEKVLENFAGYDSKEQKWKPGKFLKNMAIAVGCAALCAIPVAGPIIGAGLLATGVVTGVVGVAKGAKRAAQATTVSEKDKAWQDMGSGAFIGVTSAMGLKGAGKAFRTANPKGVKIATKNGVKTLKPSEGFGSDFINAFKGTKANVQADKIMVKNQGVWGATKTKFASAWRKCASKDKFDESMANSKKALDDKIAQLEAKTNRTPLEETKLQSLKSQRTKLDTVKTREDWKEFKKSAADSSDDIKVLEEALKNVDEHGMVTVNGQQVKATDVKTVISEIKTGRSEFGSVAENLFAQKTEAMKDMSFFRARHYKNELAEFAGVKNHNFQYGTNIRWNALKDSWKWHSFITLPVKTAFQATMLPFGVAAKFQNNGCATFNYIDQTANPFYAPSMIGMMLEMFDAFGGNAEAQEGAAEQEQVAQAQ